MNTAFYPHEIDIHPDRERINETIREYREQMDMDFQELESDYLETICEYREQQENVRNLEGDFDMLEEMIEKFLNRDEHDTARAAIMSQVELIRCYLGEYVDYKNLGKQY